jgi:hypothetical protein
MNKKYRIFAASAIACVFAACSSDSVADKEINEEIIGFSVSDVETFDDLPSCSKSRQDSVMLVKSEKLAYGCYDKRWTALGELYETEDDLPNCSDKRDGLVAYLLEENEKVVCSDGRWEEVSDDVSVKLSSSSKENSKKSSASKDDEDVSSSSKKNGSSDSGAVVQDSSSSSVLVTSGSSSSNPVSSQTGSKTTCEAPYTTRTAGPRGYWGDFGYVVPLKITTTSTQNLYVAFDTAETFINSGVDWRSYSMLIALYDSEENRWVPGTEIFSDDVKDATTINGYQYSTVNTYGMFELFTFDAKGTWLEEHAGETVDVVVNFYANGVPSDSSGTGLDFYAIPLDHPRLYYSETEVDCVLPLKGLRYLSGVGDYSNCGIYRNSITAYQGDTVVWDIGMMIYRNLVNKPWFSMSLEIGEIVNVAYDNPTDELSQRVTAIHAVYPLAGQFTESLKIMGLPGLESRCTAMPIEVLPR